MSREKDEKIFCTQKDALLHHSEWFLSLGILSGNFFKLLKRCPCVSLSSIDALSILDASA